MYETVIMVKAGRVFTYEEIDAIVHEVSGSDKRRLEVTSGSWIIHTGSNYLPYLRIDHHVAPHIKEESQELARNFGLDCAHCVDRYEMEGNDPDTALFNDFLLITEKLHQTGKLIVFDAAQGELYH